MSVPAVIGLITLGGRDVEAARRFCRDLGSELSSSCVEGEVSFDPFWPVGQDGQDGLPQLPQLPYVR